MALELIKISEFPQVNEPSEWIAVADANGIAYKISKADFKEWLGTVTVIADKPISPSDPAPTLDGVYLPMVAGTYANAGGLVYDPEGVDLGKDVTFIKNGATWTKRAVDLPEAENKIKTWTETFYSHAAQVLNGTTAYELKEGQEATEDDVPSYSSEKWEPKLDLFADPDKIWSAVGNINKFYGTRDDSSTGAQYRSSYFLRIIDRANLRVSGFSGATNNVALVAFYDRSLKYLGFYNSTEEGDLYNVTVPEASIPVKAYYIKTTVRPPNRGMVVGVSFDSTMVTSPHESLEKTKLWEGFGYIYFETGEVSSPENTIYRYSKFLRILNPAELFIHIGFSGTNVAVCAFYDEHLNFISSYRAPENGYVYDFKVPEEDVPSNAVYVRFSYRGGSANYIRGVDLTESLGYDSGARLMRREIAENNKTVFNIPLPSLFNRVGYINKTNGEPSDVTSSSYRYSAFLKIVDRDNLVVSGFSGASNNASLAYFYNDKFQPLSAYNTDHFGTIYNHKIEPEDIPDPAVYVIFTRTDAQIIYFSGVSVDYNPSNTLEYIETLQRATSSSGGPKSARGVKPNVDLGGHIKMLNYLGNDQNIHPKVLYFETPWNGYRYWMAYTPYPAGDVDAENPCIAVSSDGMTWTTPSGLTNPLAYRLDTDNYNSDTHLLYRNDTNTLECWWREYKMSAAQDAIVRSVSTDGINWGPKEYCFDYGDHTGNMLSPAVVFEDGKYKLWCRNTRIRYTESVTGDAGTWLPLEDINMDLTGITAWHLDVQVTPFGREFIIQGYTPGNDNNTSDLYHSITKDDVTYSKPEVLLERGDRPSDPDYQGIYRSCILYINGVYYLWYTGIGRSFSSRTLNLSTGRRLSSLRGVNLW